MGNVCPAGRQGDKNWGHGHGHGGGRNFGGGRLGGASPQGQRLQYSDKSQQRQQRLQFYDNSQSSASANAKNASNVRNSNSGGVSNGKSGINGTGSSTHLTSAQAVRYSSLSHQPLFTPADLQASNGVCKTLIVAGGQAVKVPITCDYDTVCARHKNNQKAEEYEEYEREQRRMEKENANAASLGSSPRAVAPGPEGGRPGAAGNEAFLKRMEHKHEQRTHERESGAMNAMQAYRKQQRAGGNAATGSFSTTSPREANHATLWDTEKIRKNLREREQKAAGGA